MPWISVKDRLPPEGHLVDVWRRGQGRLANCYCFYKGYAHYANGTPLGMWNQKFVGYAGGASVTHWMEIPGPPPGEGDL